MTHYVLVTWDSNTELDDDGKERIVWTTKTALHDDGPKAAMLYSYALNFHEHAYLYECDESGRMDLILETERMPGGPTESPPRGR